MKKIASLFITSMIGAFIALFAYTTFIETPVEKVVTIEKTSSMVVVDDNLELNKESKGKSPSLVLAAEKTVDAVVHVKTSFFDTYTDFFDPFDFDLFWGFGDNFQKKDREPYKRSASGSGVIITSDGYIVTNNHVVDNAEEIQIVLNDKRTYDADVVGRDPASDLAVLKINETKLPYAIFTNSDNVKVGEWVLAVGNPFNLKSTVTAGIVSAKGRDINIIDNKYAIESFIQTDAAVNPGNSGGALVNVEGELIGINTAISTHTGSFEGYSFAVPSNLVKKVVDDLLEYGTVQRAFIGVTIRNINAEMAAELEINNLEGVYVEDISEGGAAESSGIEKGDVILTINGVTVSKSSELQEQVSKYRPGDKILLDIDRKGKRKLIKVILKNKAGNTDVVKKEENNVQKLLGANFKNLSKTELETLGVDNGVKVLTLEPGKMARAGIREGFVITSINNKPAHNVKEVLKILSDVEGGGVYIEGVYRKGTRHYYAFGL